MSKKPYDPPSQSIAGQTIDSLFLLVLVMAALFTPIYLGLAGGGKTALEFADKSWKGMGQSEAQAAAWEKLGFTAGEKTEENATAAVDILAARFDYSFDPMWLGITALVVFLYFYIVVHFSKQEYRDVISERFDK